MSLEELETNEYNVQFIESLLNALFDRKVEDFKKSADLINYLFKEGVFTLEDITKGWAFVNISVTCFGLTTVDSLELQVAEIESNAIDAPNLYKHMGILLGKLILEGVLNLSILPRIFSGIIKSRSLVPPAPKLLGELLSGIRTEEGDDALVDAVQAEPIKYELFWSPDSFNEKVLADWMEKYSLAVLSLSAGDEEPVDLEAKIKELNGNGQELAEWIDVHILIIFVSSC